jgi:uncharacterized membrane protein
MIEEKPELREKKVMVRAGPDMETIVGRLLQFGVLTSALLIIVGLVWYKIGGGQLSDMHTLLGMNLAVFIESEIRRAAAGQVRPSLVIALGIIVLLLTPYLRVLFSVFYFALAGRNWKYTLFTLFVLSVLTYSLFVR